MMDARSASLEWIDEFSFQMFHADTLKACLHTGVSWLSDWIDPQFPTRSHWITGASDYHSFCRSMASEVGICERLERGDQNLTLASLETLLQKLKVRIRDVFPD
jgi:hypothetical protein